MKTRLLPILMALMLCWPVGCARSAAVTPLTIHTQQGTRTFQVEIAATPQAQERGLMFRRAMADNAGMLFVYGTPQQLTFWMKNTYIPLDLLFIDEGARIVFIHANARPLSEALITAPVPAVAVLEINGGLSSRLGIAVGDSVRWTRP
jgi:uncharacterized membrane protein (UPF0127 family)